MSAGEGGAQITDEKGSEQQGRRGKRSAGRQRWENAPTKRGKSARRRATLGVSDQSRAAAGRVWLTGRLASVGTITFSFL